MTLDHFSGGLEEALRRPDDAERFSRDHLGYIDDVLAALERWDRPAGPLSEPPVNP